MEKLCVYLIALAVFHANALILDDAEEASNRISSGTAAAENQFPYAVSLLATQVGPSAVVPQAHRCGGVLITLQHVLTTASCVTEVNNNGVVTVINGANYQIFGGSRLLTNQSADRVRPIANFTVHPDFIAAPAYLNNIAIITLNVPFSNAIVTPLELPSATFDPADFTLCTFAGWGATVTGATAQPSAQLNYARKYVYNQNLCTYVFNNLAGTVNIFPSMVCAASFDIISTGCQGDNGGALVCNNTLTGLLFFHNNCVATSYPEIYTRVSNYTSWIRSITGSASTFSPAVFMLSLLTVSQVLVAKVVS